MQPTNSVAVFALIVSDERLLLLDRVNEPCVWAPPGGKLLQHESPFTGLIREVKEETNLEIQVADSEFKDGLVWFGSSVWGPFLALFFNAEVLHGEVILSDEHRSAGWFTQEEIETMLRRRIVFGNLDLYLSAFNSSKKW